MSPSADEVYQVVSTGFDAAFYQTAYPHLRAVDDPLRHYLTHGWREGLDPAPWFSVDAYLAANPDVADADLEPLHHFLTVGRREGREIAPSRQAAAWRAGPQAVAPWDWRFAPGPDALSAPVAEDPDLEADDDAPADAMAAAPQPDGDAAPQLTAAEMAAVAALFDAEFYRDVHADVARAGVDPLDHFLTDGWREGRNPNRWFSLSDYGELYPDVVAAGCNPFVHYVLTGRAEGRAPRAGVGFRYRIATDSRPVAERVRRAAAGAAKVKAGAAADLEAALQAAGLRGRRLHVTFSHDDYTAHAGGVQFSLRREAEAATAQGLRHLHIHPATHWPVVRTGAEPASLGVLVDGRRLGSFAAEDLIRALAQVGAALPAPPSFAIHSLLGHVAEDVVAMLQALGARQGFFWLHDFASLCAGVHLLRNDVEDCAAPPPDSTACAICSYGALRGRHLEAHAVLFTALDLTVVSPSQGALDLWRSRSGLPVRGALIHPHARLARRGVGPQTLSPQLRIAYLGFPVDHKGWPVFYELAAAHVGDARYDFLHLGARRVPGAPAGFHRIVTTRRDPQAMRRAIEALGVDMVLIWPLCRETFSLVAYEAVAAGAAVVTWRDSGNVADFVRDGGHGLVLHDEAELAALFRSGAALDLARRRRRPERYDLIYSALTMDLVAPETAEARLAS